MEKLTVVIKNTKLSKLEQAISILLKGKQFLEETPSGAVINVTFEIEKPKPKFIQYGPGNLPERGSKVFGWDEYINGDKSDITEVTFLFYDDLSKSEYKFIVIESDGNRSFYQKCSNIKPE